MVNTEVETTGELSFKFEGEYDVNALTLARSIEGLVELSTVTASHNCPEVEVRLSVRAVKPGSLAIAFMIATSALQTLISPEGVEYASNLVAAIVAFFEIKGFLKGKSPKSVNKNEGSIIIESTDGSKITVPKSAGVFFIDQSIDKSVTHIIENASISPGVSGITISSANTTTTIKRQNFEQCTTPIELKPADNKQVTYTRRDVLFIRKPDLMGDSQWGFKADKNIMADMADENFVKMIHSREVMIFSGMHLVADVEITTEIGDDGIPTDSPCHYSVKKVVSWGAPEDLQLHL